LPSTFPRRWARARPHGSRALAAVFRFRLVHRAAGLRLQAWAQPVGEFGFGKRACGQRQDHRMQLDVAGLRESAVEAREPFVGQDDAGRIADGGDLGLHGGGPAERAGSYDECHASLEAMAIPPEKRNAGQARRFPLPRGIAAAQVSDHCRSRLW
jgi:hypothetical protein